jgi:group I intron endonuclease
MIKNKLNKKMYIGITDNFYRRMSEHMTSATNINMIEEIKRVGVNNFVCGVIKTFSTRYKAQSYESFLIKKFHNSNKPLYNIAIPK